MDEVVNGDDEVYEFCYNNTCDVNFGNDIHNTTQRDLADLTENAKYGTVSIKKTAIREFGIRPNSHYKLFHSATHVLYPRLRV